MLFSPRVIALWKSKQPSHGNEIASRQRLDQCGSISPSADRKNQIDINHSDVTPLHTCVLHRCVYCPHTQETGWHSHEVHCCAPQTVAQGSNAIHLQLSVVFVARTSSPAVSPRQAMIPCWVPVMYANCTCAAWGDPCACQHQTGETKLQKEGRGDAAGRAARLKQSRQWQRLTCCPPGWWSCTSPS